MLFGPKYSPTPTATEPRSSSTTSNTGVVEVSGQEQSARKRGIRYRAFGKRFTLSGSNPARRDPSFQNRTYDAGLGIYDYRNRSFDPATGRFLQRDPVLGGDSLFNPYVFPGNNPVGNVDPMGLGLSVAGGKPWSWHRLEEVILAEKWDDDLADYLRQLRDDVTTTHDFKSMDEMKNALKPYAVIGSTGKRTERLVHYKVHFPYRSTEGTIEWTTMTETVTVPANRASWQAKFVEWFEPTDITIKPSMPRETVSKSTSKKAVNVEPVHLYTVTGMEVDPGGWKYDYEEITVAEKGISPRITVYYRMKESIKKRLWVLTVKNVDGKPKLMLTEQPTGSTESGLKAKGVKGHIVTADLRGKGCLVTRIYEQSLEVLSEQEKEMGKRRIMGRGEAELIRRSSSWLITGEKQIGKAVAKTKYGSAVWAKGYGADIWTPHHGHFRIRHDQKGFEGMATPPSRTRK